MFAEFVFEQSGAKYTNRILIIDSDNLISSTKITEVFKAHNFEVIHYINDLDLRLNYEDKIKSSSGCIAIFANKDQYVPYDIIQRVHVYNLSLSSLFSRLNSKALIELGIDKFDLVTSAYENNFEQCESYELTKKFIDFSVYSSQNVSNYLKATYELILSKTSVCKDCLDWFSIAEEKARIDCIAAKQNVSLDTSEINKRFSDYILNQYKNLSTVISSKSPILVSKTIEFIRNNSEKFILIVMDGMSEFDWHILSNSFKKINYIQTAAYAMIPTVTSVSRQCLLSNKYPIQLDSPWNQAKEKKEFIECLKQHGLSDNQISYQRGYDAEFGPLVKCGTVIINEIDDLVHAQKYGREGMYRDVNMIREQGKLAKMTWSFLSLGYDVYITADHGNTLRCGMGKLTSTGVELETKSKCMLVLKNFANKHDLQTRFGLIDFPKYFLPKEFDYLICDVGDSFDNKGDKVMSHGGVSIDECIVPFIVIKAKDNNV